MPRALLIDFGGTIAREVPPRHVIYAEAAARVGLDVTDGAMAGLMAEAHDALPREVDGGYRYSRPWFEAFIERIFARRLGLDPGALPGVRAELFGRFADPRTFRVHADARALLDAARARGLSVAVVSNWSDALEELVDALELGPFDALVSSAVERCEKPSPAIFEVACRRLGVPPTAAIHVGDSRRNDAEGAAALGIRAVLVHRAAAPADPIDGAPFEVVASLDEAIPLLDRD